MESLLLEPKPKYPHYISSKSSRKTLPVQTFHNEGGAFADLIIKDSVLIFKDGL